MVCFQLVMFSQDEMKLSMRLSLNKFESSRIKQKNNKKKIWREQMRNTKEILWALLWISLPSAKPFPCFEHHQCQHHPVLQWVSAWLVCKAVFAHCAARFSEQRDTEKGSGHMLRWIQQIYKEDYSIKPFAGIWVLRDGISNWLSILTHKQHLKYHSALKYTIISALKTPPIN